ncbi:MAG: hypothetical protein ACREBS_10960 [Nitrososphaerales archaeon]
MPVKWTGKSQLASLSILAIILGGTMLPLLSASTEPDSSTLQVKVQSGQYIQVSTPKGSNINLVSVSGGQYRLSSSTIGNLNAFQFTPTNSSIYTLVLNVTSNATSYAFVSKQSAAAAIDTTLENITNYGMLHLTIQVNSTSSTLAESGWSPLFGMTGLKLQAGSFSFNEALEVLFAVGVLVTGLGILFRSRVSYLGIVFLFFVGVVVLGLLMMFGVIILYLFSFALVNLAWKIRTWKMR